MRCCGINHHAKARENMKITIKKILPIFGIFLVVILILWAVL